MIDHGADEDWGPNFADAYRERALAYEKKGEKAKVEEDLAPARDLGGKAK